MSFQQIQRDIKGQGRDFCAEGAVGRHFGRPQSLAAIWRDSEEREGGAFTIEIAEEDSPSRARAHRPLCVAARLIESRYPSCCRRRSLPLAGCSRAFASAARRSLVADTPQYLRFPDASDG